MFRYDWHRGRPFTHSGATPRCPHPTLDILQLRNRKELQQQRNVFDLLKPLEEIQPALDQCALANNRNSSFERDLEWRKIHLGKGLGYWDTVVTDIPYQMSDGVALPAFGPVRAGSLGKKDANWTRPHSPSTTISESHSSCAIFLEPGIVLTVFTFARLTYSVDKNANTVDRCNIDHVRSQRNRLCDSRSPYIPRRFSRNNLQ